MYNPSKLLDLQRSALFFQLGHGGGKVVVAGLVAVVGSNDWSKWFETVRLIPVISVCVIPQIGFLPAHISEHSTSKRQDRSLSPVLCVSCANVDISSSPSPTIAKGSNCIRSLTCRAPDPEPGCRPVNPKLRPFAPLFSLSYL